MTATVMTHAGVSQLITLDALRQLPEPVPQGKRHKPIKFDLLVDAFTAELAKNGADVTNQEFSLGNEGAKLLGVMEFNKPNLVSMEGVSPAFGFRASYNQTFAMKGVAGGRVWVCDNTLMSGTEIVLQRKQTTGVVLEVVVAEAVSRIFTQYADLNAMVERLSNTALTDNEAKALMLDAFVGREPVMPVRVMPEVAWWFTQAGPEGEAPDCEPRTAYGLHNAFTRTVKTLATPNARFEAARAVSAYFSAN